MKTGRVTGAQALPQATDCVTIIRIEVRSEKMNPQDSVLCSVTRLTQQLKAGGCASKLAPGSLRAALDLLPPQTDPNLLVGFDRSDESDVSAVPAGLLANCEFAECVVRNDGHVDDDPRLLTHDPQTSGGLLVSVQAGDAESVVQALHEAGVAAQPIGHVIAGQPEIILRGDRS